MAVDYRQVAAQKAEKYGIPPELFVRQIGAESNFQVGARSPVGAQGIAQIMPATAKSWGVNPHNPVAALDAAAKNMAKYTKQYGGNYAKALAAYNAGPGAVAKYNGIPPYKETQDYVRKIMGPGGAKAVTLTRRPTAPAPVELTLEGPVGPTPTRRFSDQQSLVAQNVFRNNPRMVGLLQRAEQSDANRLKMELAGLAGAAATEPSIPAPARRAAKDAVKSGPGTNYLSLFTWAHRNFGAKLDNPDVKDPHNRQVQGGSHTKKSNHYAGLAIDLGDAKNDRATMNRLASYAKRNPHLFSELYFNPLGWGIKNGKVVKGLTVKGHDRHMHLAVPGRRK